MAKKLPIFARVSDQPTDWFRIVNKKAEDGSGPDEADVFIYDEIGGGFWSEGVNAQDLVKEVAALDVSKLNVHINSPGGDVFDGVAIYNALKAHKADVHVTVDALAASAASFIAQAGDTITMSLGSTMMIHDAAGLAYGPAAEMDKMSELLNKVSNNIADIYAASAGGTPDEWRATMRAETWYSAQEAVDAGLATEVAASANSAAQAKAKNWNLSVFNYSGRDKAPAPSEVRQRILNKAKEAEVSGQNEPTPTTPNVTITAGGGGAGGGGGGAATLSTFLCGGKSMTAHAEVQAYITNLENRNSLLEAAANEAKLVNRKGFVNKLAADNKILASAIPSLEDFVADLSDSQYEKWTASWEAAPVLGVLSPQGEGSVTNSDGTKPAGTAPASPSQTETDKAMVRQHKLAAMDPKVLAETPSAKRLVAAGIDLNTIK